MQQARTAAATGTTFDAAAALAQITTVAAVQQQDLASDVSALSTRVAADPALDVAATSNTLAEVRCAPPAARPYCEGRLRAVSAAATPSCAAQRARLPACHRPPLAQALSTPPAARGPLCTPQAYSGDALQQKIVAKAAALPDLMSNIQQQLGGLGQPPPPAGSPVAAYVRNAAGIIAGTGG